MTPSEKSLLEFEILAEEYLTGTIDAAGADQLIEICKANPNAVDRLLDHLVVNEVLNDMRKYGNAGKTPTETPFRKKIKISWLRFLYRGHRLWSLVYPGPRVFNSICFFAVLAFAGIIAYCTWDKMNRDHVAPPPIAQKTILLKTRGARWENVAPEKLYGDLGSDWLRLLDGFALIDFSSGTKVALDGLTEFRPVSENRAVCTRGNITVSVSKRGTGFRVDLPHISVIDLGTRFRTETDETESRIYVLEGKVSLVDPGSSSKTPIEKCLLMSGESARINANGAITRLTGPVKDFGKSADFLDENRCRLIAHRGATALAPECTLPAFRKAIELKASGCSIPVFVSKDKQLVVLAESQLKRTSSVRGLVEQFDIASLKKLDVGKWKGPEFAGEKIPTLEEVLELFADSECIPYVELMVDGVESDVISLLRKKNLLERSVVVSSMPNVLRDIRRIEPRVVTCWRHSQKKTLRRNAEYFASEARKIGTNQIIVEPLSDDLLRELINIQKLEIGCWTVNDPGTAERLLNIGVSQIATDKLSLLNNVVP